MCCAELGQYSAYSTWVMCYVEGCRNDSLGALHRAVQVAFPGDCTHDCGQTPLVMMMGGSVLQTVTQHKQQMTPHSKAGDSQGMEQAYTQQRSQATLAECKHGT
jgi:hypothetical protein